MTKTQVIRKARLPIPTLRKIILANSLLVFSGSLAVSRIAKVFHPRLPNIASRLVKEMAKPNTPYLTFPKYRAQIITKMLEQAQVTMLATSITLKFLNILLTAFTLFALSSFEAFRLHPSAPVGVQPSRPFPRSHLRFSAYNYFTVSTHKEKKGILGFGLSRPLSLNSLNWLFM